MQGPHYLDLARTLSDERLREDAHKTVPRTPHTTEARQTARERVGRALISIGERLAPADIQLRVSTGPPCN